MRLVTIAMISIALLGCGKSARKVSAREFLAMHKQFRDEMCKCAKGNPECEREVTRARDKFRELPGDDAWDAEIRPLDKELAEVNDIFTRCSTTAMLSRDAELVPDWKTPEVATVEKLHDQMCACGKGDADCVLKANYALLKWETAVNRNPNYVGGERERLALRVNPTLQMIRACERDATVANAP